MQNGSIGTPENAFTIMKREEHTMRFVYEILPYCMMLLCIGTMSLMYFLI